MRASVAVVIVGMIAGFAPARAQTGVISSPNLTAPPPDRAIPSAPVGHRQPRVGDIPGERVNSDNPQASIDREDAALDRKIKNICKGC